MPSLSKEMKALDKEFLSTVTSVHKGNPAFECGPPQLQLFLEKAIKERTGLTKHFTPKIIQMRRKEEQCHGGMDPYYVRLMHLLHLKEYPQLPVPSVLQFKVEEAIKYYAGITKDLSLCVRVMLANPKSKAVNMSLGELDTYYIKSLGSLHGGEVFVNMSPTNLQMNLEEAIKSKTGVIKDYSTLIASFNNRPLEEVRTTAHGFEESKTTSSSDNELELDLFNEDLMCIICNGMDVGARNRLLECSDCHSLYHQECHRPPVTSMDTEGNWTCQNCKDASKRLKKSTPGSSPSHAATPSPVTTKPTMKNSPPHSQRLSVSNGGTSASSNYKAPTTKPITSSSAISKPNTTSSKSSSGKTSSVASSSGKSSVTPNIISADKRLQIMKKKAAKLHEKRKLPR